MREPWDFLRLTGWGRGDGRIVAGSGSASHLKSLARDLPAERVEGSLRRARGSQLHDQRGQAQLWVLWVLRVLWVLWVLWVLQGCAAGGGGDGPSPPLNRACGLSKTPCCLRDLFLLLSLSCWQESVGRGASDEERRIKKEARFLRGPAGYAGWTQNRGHNAQCLISSSGPRAARGRQVLHDRWI